MARAGRSFKLLLVAGLIAALGLVGAGTASAHNALTDISPADGAQVATGPTQVLLTFDQVVQNYEPLVTVTGPDNTRWEGSPIAVLNNTVTTPINVLGPAGTYTIAYRIISADGHPVEGVSTFTLTAAGTGTANPVTDDPVATDSGLPVWVWIVGALVVVAALTVGAIVSSRRRSGLEN